MLERTKKNGAEKEESVDGKETQPAESEKPAVEKKVSAENKEKVAGTHRVKKLFRRAGRFSVVVLIVAAAFLVGRFCGRSGEHHHDHDHAAGAPEKSAEQTVYTCPMHPQVRLTDPKAKCPLCAMDLVPAESDDAGETGPGAELRMSPRAQKLAQIETSSVIRKNVEAEIRVFGRTAYDERRLGHITSWVEGRIERLFVRFTGARVSRGQPMVRVYSPELVSAQMELVQALQFSRETKRGDPTSEFAELTLNAARHKLSLMGLSAAQIARIEKSGKPSDRVTVHAPAGGVVIEKEAKDGMYVKPGTRLFTIADLSRLWVNLDVYESDLGLIKVGRKVSFNAEAYPGETFEGEVEFIDPFVDERTRTVRVRLTVDNKDLRLKPDMFVRGVVKSAVDEDGRATSGGKDKDSLPLVIPRSAPLVTGTRAVVYVEKEPGLYQGREILLGPRVGEHYIVRDGLTEGEKVVTRGNFKIDSALQIMARPSMMSPAEPESDQDKHQHHHHDHGPDCPHHAHHAGERRAED